MTPQEFVQWLRDVSLTLSVKSDAWSEQDGEAAELLQSASDSLDDAANRIEEAS